ncbi:MAG TPA: class I SAM-dependent methyltransferase [Vicinamibacterales bacterium]|nr:class I SAM-dependent methyltransferase [Vicinamibacterales bacterium]
MGVASHLGIRIDDYDTKIRTFIPGYEEMLGEAAAALCLVRRRAPVVLELGIGSGALAARCLRVVPGARIIGLDTDGAMLSLARQRLGGRVTTIRDDFLSAPLPACDAVTSSFALHHVRTPARKAALYRRLAAALRPGGVAISADCFLSSHARLQARDRDAWHAHLAAVYGAAGATRFLRAWAKEDTYFPLNDEVAWLERAGFGVDVPWRRGGFAVVVGVRQPRRR